MSEPEYRLPADTMIGCVRLRVADLPRSIQFYDDLLGLRTAQHDERSAELSPTGESPGLIRLEEHRGIRRRPDGTRGLYHYALLYPDRRDLGRALFRLFENRVPFAGFADHGVSEAAYLTDPDGNGIELAADRPREQWQRQDGEIAMFTHTLNVTGLLRPVDGDPWLGMPSGTRVGHVHLHVTDLVRAEEFYHGLLGFDVTNRNIPGALFLAAGGYHHHLGVNTWARGKPIPDSEIAGLDEFEIALGGAAERAALIDRVSNHLQLEPKGAGALIHDPDGNAIRIA